ncbi:DUF1214 domain-containing protein [Arthrobacter sp. KBS0702]|nr:DUF1214 domain-containing protein [Arthrobacter sp. KBS0702]
MLADLAGGVLNLPAGILPPNDAFWSLIPTAVAGYKPNNPARRCGVGERSPLARNAVDSVDSCIRHQAMIAEALYISIPSTRSSGPALGCGARGRSPVSALRPGPPGGRSVL